MAEPSSSSSSSPFPPQNLKTLTDAVVYSLYPDDPSPSSLQSLHFHILTQILPSFVPSAYIWHHDPFNLSLSSSPIPHLRGSSRFGDNLDDEWLIAALLFEISRRIPDLSISLRDSDGEFLLIEAAFHLPRRLRPDNSANRIFVRGGLLHIIPQENLTLESALSILKSGKIDTRASEPVQVAIGKRISEYPERATRNMHRIRVRVPVAVAAVLKEEPCLISLAVEGFYDRDVDSMKDAMRMERFLGRKEKGEAEEMVLVSVLMTRAMYGQLVMQSFQAPKCYPMPARSDTVFTEAELGMKIACGFEMMYQERKRAGEEGRGESWDVYVKSLERSGVFDGVLPGSNEYKRVMEGAMEYYKKSSLFNRTRDMLSAPVRRIDEILALPHSAADFNRSELPPSDDDSWLYDGEEELNAAISERQKEMEAYELERRKNRKTESRKLEENNFSMQSDDYNFKDVADSMQAFIHKLSSFEGAEIPRNRGSNEVELDVHQFFKEIESVIGHVSNDKAISGSEEGSTSSSEMDFDESDDASDIAETCEVDDSGDTFMESYSDALNKELNATTLKKSFIRASQQPSTDKEGTSNASKDVEELTPVDVDVNLVKSLLDSVSSQEGLPGPASNLLGLMGLNLPHVANNK